MEELPNLRIFCFACLASYNSPFYQEIRENDETWKVIRRNIFNRKVSAVLIIEENLKRAIVAFKGSDNLNDVNRNVQGFITNYLWKRDFESSKQIMNDVQGELYNYTFFVTGHSAGGTIAQFISATLNLPGISINACPLHHTSIMYDEKSAIRHPYIPFVSRKFINHVIQNEAIWYFMKNCEDGNLNKFYYGEIVTHYNWQISLCEEDDRLKLHYIENFNKIHCVKNIHGGPCSHSGCDLPPIPYSDEDWSNFVVQGISFIGRKIGKFFRR